MIHHAEDERRAREDLAAAYRLVAHFGWDDLIFTHISMRVPGTDDAFLINPYGMLFSEITASSLVKIDHEGNKLEPSDYPVNPAGFTIHSAIHMARPDLHCVMHTHTIAGIAVSTLAEGLLPINQASLPFYERVAYHDYEGLANDLDERERIVADLGPSGRAMILRNHGLLTAGASPEEAFLAMYFLERACQIQVAALGMGRALNPLPPAVCDKTARQYEMASSAGVPSPWPGLLRLLDTVSPGYLG
jgi:ribulose-5-phosphate 4-epimerase/fuculose-1-phosphate aldolase